MLLVSYTRFDNQEVSRCIDFRALPMHKHADVYWLIWECCQCTTMAKF